MQFCESDIAGVLLVDHHCHGVVEKELDRAGFESMITESNWPPPPGTTVFDSQLGTAVRNWCAPLLGLEPFVPAEDYLARRVELGAQEVNERLLQGAGIGRYLIETGFRGGDILAPQQMAERAGSASDEVLRLEKIAEDVISENIPASAYTTRFVELLTSRLQGAVGVKTIAAYRCGLDFDATPPTVADVTAAVAAWQKEIASGAEPRVTDPVIIRFGIWAAVELQQPIQFHIGFGDPDVDLRTADPLQLNEFLRLTRTSGARILLLHCYPFHRNAGYLAHVYPHVYCDVGLSLNYVGARSQQVLAESLELTPFDKALFSSDAWGLAELYFLGAKLFRTALAKTLNEWIADGHWDAGTAQTLVKKICHDNAVRVYNLPGEPRFLGGQQ